MKKSEGVSADEIMGTMLREYPSADSRFTLERIYYRIEGDKVVVYDYAFSTESRKWHPGMWHYLSMEWVQAVKQIPIPAAYLTNRS